VVSLKKGEKVVLIYSLKNGEGGREKKKQRDKDRWKIDKKKKRCIEER
jgi:hypothetical protein